MFSLIWQPFRLFFQKLTSEESWMRFTVLGWCFTLSCAELLQPEDTVPTSVLCGPRLEKSLEPAAGPTMHTPVPLLLPLYTSKGFLLLSLITQCFWSVRPLKCTVILDSKWNVLLMCTDGLFRFNEGKLKSSCKVTAATVRTVNIYSSKGQTEYLMSVAGSKTEQRAEYLTKCFSFSWVCSAIT